MFILKYLLTPFATMNKREKRGDGLKETLYYYTDVFIFGIRIARIHRDGKAPLPTSADAGRRIEYGNSESAWLAGRGSRRRGCAVFSVLGPDGPC